jgi:hypothetical protein
VLRVMEKTDVVWAVLDQASEVVLVCWGADAPEVVEEWREKGYHIVELGAAEVDAA